MHSTLHSVQCLASSVQCTFAILSLQCTLHICHTQFAVYIAQCIMHILQYVQCEIYCVLQVAVCSVESALHSVQCTIAVCSVKCAIFSVHLPNLVCSF